MEKKDDIANCPRSADKAIHYPRFRGRVAVSAQCRAKLNDENWTTIWRDVDCPKCKRKLILVQKKLKEILEV